ncbi:unnamed protein product [Rotaria sordida]|uniref:NAD(P)(+)--arginine ADP-ribosyltransferase n=1 Tax=Rotaria sordida TaxID=392033 RepID=A0A815JHC2_9BILA|nr:unnamed protein product [Rotaria sordida]CAF1650203.1 unnamed protein product [Rotaria sordida]
MNSNIALIISSNLVELIVPSIYELSHIQMIYIHNTNNSKEKCELIKQLSSKIVDIYDNINQLIVKLFNDNLFPSLPISIINPQTIKETSIRDLTNEQATFMWFQLLLEILLQMPQTIDSKNEMMNECLLNYENDEIEKKKIIEFQQTYSSDTCIRWYTRDTFLYRLLNRALRTQNINNIFKFRFFIKDLYQQLENLAANNEMNTSVSIMYRGQMIAREELQKLQDNINGLISVNTFFSTTLSCNVATDFSGNGMGRPQFESVVFEINVNQKRLTKPFAHIHHYSYNTDENEVLFSMGTIFRIDSIELLTDEIWFVKLILNEEEDKNSSDLINHFKKEINQTEHHLMTLGKFLYLMGDLDKAEKYYRLFLDQILSSKLLFDNTYHHNEMIAMLFNDLALVYNARGNFELALKNYQHALDIYLSLEPMNPISNTAIYSNIGNVLIELGDYQKAFKMYNTALELRLLYSSIIQDEPGLAQIYNNIAVCYNQNGQYNRSIENFEKSINIKLKYLPSNHPSLGITYSNLSDLYRANGDYEMALKYCQQALDIHVLVLPKDHIDLATTYNAMANIYIDSGNSIKAKENYEKALEIILNQMLQQHQLLNTIYNNIANIYMNECHYELAIKYYKLALDKIDSSNLTNHAVIYNNLGEIYRKIGNYMEALINHKKALDIRMTLYPSLDHIDLAQSYHNVGIVFCDNGQYDTALDCFKSALDIKEKILNPNHSSIAKTYMNIAEIYRKQWNYIESLKYNEKALKIEKQQSPLNNSDLATIYNNIGLTYLDENNFILAMENFQQSLDLKLKSSDSNDLSLSMTYINIATVYSEKSDYTSALAYLQRALNIKLQHLPPNHLEFGLLYNNIGAIYLKAQHFIDACESFKHALGIYLQNPLSNTSEIATIFSNIGALYQLNGEYKLAKENYENSLLYDLKSLPEDHPSIIQTKQQISLIDTLL